MFSEKQGLGECEMMERRVVEPGFLLALPPYLSLFPLFLPPVALLLVLTTLSFCQSGIVPSSGEGEEEEEESLLRFVGPWQWLGEPWHLAPEQKSHPVKTFEGHPVAAGLWDTPQVANT